MVSLPSNRKPKTPIKESILKHYTVLSTSQWLNASLKSKSKNIFSRKVDLVSKRSKRGLRVMSPAPPVYPKLKLLTAASLTKQIASETSVL